ncbi:hypothetical protein CHH54_12675 [Bacillus sp. 7520-S]|nr:hypothetical protein CHH54_12675 [Bacillus sp. 7520-S]
MDRITNSLMNKFSQTMEINTKDRSKLFEAFATYTVVSKITDVTLDTSDIMESNIEGKKSGIVGGAGGDLAIDGLAISLNGQLITDISEVTDLFSESSTVFEAVLIFVQAKTSSNFDGGQIRNFGDGIVDFLSEDPQMVRNEFINNRWNIVNHIIDNADKIKKFICKAYYITVGKWTNDKNLLAKVGSVRKSIEAQNIFQEIDVVPVDAESLREMYQNLETKLTSKIEFPKRVLLPEVEGISEAYIGYIQVEEYLNLIEDEEHNLRKSIFYDNIRDYQGENDVNLNISDTLSSNHADRLAVLNNGVTVISEDIQLTRDTVTLSNYQVVNGCQTSYVIYFNKDNIQPNVYLPIKIVATQNEEIINEIIVANNSQTEVKKEELIALTTIQKRLEAYYESFNDKKQRLYYERRSKQFASSNNIEKVRIVTISTQLRSFCGMFLDVPHMASRYYGRLFKEYSTKVFNNDNELMLYYTAAFSLYKLEYFIRNKSIEQKYRKFKYHLLMLLRYHLGGSSLPRLNSKRNIETYCGKINEVMWDNEKALEEFKFLITIVYETVEDLMSNEVTSKKYLNDQLLEKLQERMK